MFVRRICCPPAANWNKLAVFATWAGFSMGECLSQLILDGLGFLGKEMALSPCARWTSRPAPAKPTEVYVHQTDRSLRHAVPHRSNHNAVSGQIFSSFTNAVVSLYVSFLIICWCELRKTFQEDSKHQAQCCCQMPHWKLSAIFRRMGEPLDVQPFQLRWPPLPVSSLMTSQHFAAFSQRARALVSDSGSDLAVAQSVQMDGFKIQSPFLDQDPSSFFLESVQPFSPPYSTLRSHCAYWAKHCGLKGQRMCCLQTVPANLQPGHFKKLESHDFPQSYYQNGSAWLEYSINKVLGPNPRSSQMFLEREQPLGLERQGFCTRYSQLKTCIPKRSVLKLLWQPPWLWPFLDVIVAVWPRRMRGETVVQNRITVAQSASISWHGSGKMVVGYRCKQSSQHFRAPN